MLPDIRRILYATGLGAGAPYVFRHALGLARDCAAEVTVLHAMEPLSPFAQNLVELHIEHTRSAEQHAAARQQVREKIERRLDLLCDKETCRGPEGRDLVTDIKVVDGHPAETILAVAAEIEADLIVLGTHRHTALGEALVGSTAHKVLHRSPLPVLLVRIPDGYQEHGL